MKKIENGIVFSEDIELILNGNNAYNFNFEERGIKIPDKTFIKNLRIEFKNLCKLVYGIDIVIVTEEEMIEAMNNIIKSYENKYQIV